MRNDKWKIRVLQAQLLSQNILHFPFQLSHLSFVFLLALSLLGSPAVASHLPTDARAFNSSRVSFLSLHGVPQSTPLSRIFLQDSNGRRPVFGGTEKFQTDPYWRDLVPFHEYFHGDNGSGIGASHQTGWTGLVAKLLQQSGE